MANNKLVQEWQEQFVREGTLDNLANLATIPKNMTNRQLLAEIEQGTELGNRVAAEISALENQDYSLGAMMTPKP
jgi:hypothetical protein